VFLARLVLVVVVVVVLVVVVGVVLTAQGLKARGERM
jgi:hypothetical protein